MHDTKRRIPVSKGVVPKVWLMPIKNPVESQN